MTRAPVGVFAVLAAVAAVTACGDTYVDTAVTTAPSGGASTTTLAPVRTDAPLDELLAELELLMRHLDEQIVDEQSPDVTLDRVDEVWHAAQQQIRDRDPDDLFPFEQAITLARSGVERRRPADASKGYKLLIAAIAAEGSAAAQ